MGLAILIYALVSGVAQTAHEGQFLGKRFSSVWLPIRLLTGTLLLIPVWGGMAAAQKIVLWFAVMGIGLGNLAADALTIPNVKFFVSGPVAQQLAQKEFIRQSCIAGLQFSYSSYASYMPDSGFMPPDETLCGNVTWPSPDVDEDTTTGAVAASLEARKKAFSVMSDKLKKVAVEDYYQEYDAETLKSFISDAAAEYSSNMKSMGAELAKAENGSNATEQKSTTNFIEFGFVGSFSAIKQQQISNAVSTLPQIASTEEANVSFYGDDFNRDPSICRSDLCPISWWKMRHSLSQRLGVDLTSGGQPPLRAHMTNSTAGGTGAPFQASDGDGLINKLFGKLSVKEWAANWAVGGATNPILYAQNLGQNLINAIGIAGVVAVGLAMIPAIGTPVMPAFLSIAIPLSALAIALASYLPLIPSILWLMAIVSFIVLILEGLLGGVLWALIHLDPEGEGMGNRSQRGYLFLADLFFRPAFLVIAFAAANIILIFVAGVTNGLFVKSMGNYEVGGLGSLIGFLGALGVFVMVQVGLVGRVYAQSLAIPDQIMTWLGGISTSPSVTNADANPINGQQVGEAARGLSNIRTTAKQKPNAGTDTKVS